MTSHDNRWFLKRIAVMILVAVVLTFTLFQDKADATPAEQAFVEWYHASEANRAWYHWYVWMQDPTNAAWFRWKVNGGLHPAIARHFGTGPLGRQAQRVAKCESELNPNAVSPTNDHGLFQINAVHRAAFSRVTGLAWSHVYDAYANARYARDLYNRQGWSPWTCRWAA